MKTLSITPKGAVRVLAALYCLGLPLGPAASPPTRAEENRITIELYPNGGEAEKMNSVILSFNGKLYDDLPLPEQGGASSLSDDERFLAKVIRINRTGSLDEILALWNPSERQDIRKVAADPQTFEANRKFFNAIGRSYLRAKIYYGTYVIIIVKHMDTVTGERFKDYPIKKVHGEQFLTNELREDPVFQYLTTKFIAKLRQQ